MRFGDLNNAEYNQMYETIQKLSPFEEVKHIQSSQFSIEMKDCRYVLYTPSKKA